jgi:hypothetical protein
MTTFLIPEVDKADVIFTAPRFITLKYEPGSALSNQFNGKTESVSFRLNNSDADMQKIISAFNRAFIEKRTPVQIINASLDYTASLRGDPDKLALAYKVVLKPTISRYTLETGAQSLIDLDWRDVDVNSSLVVNTPENGQMDINKPIGLINSTYPEFANQLLNTELAGMMTTPLFNFHELGMPMDRWHFLFDPTGSQAGAAGAGYAEQGGARVVSVFSLGESSFREGTHSAQEQFATGTIGDTSISGQSSTPPPNGQLQIAGFARIQKVDTGATCPATRRGGPSLRSRSSARRAWSPVATT